MRKMGRRTAHGCCDLWARISASARAMQRKTSRNCGRRWLWILGAKVGHCHIRLCARGINAPNASHEHRHHQHRIVSLPKLEEKRGFAGLDT